MIHVYYVGPFLHLLHIPHIVLAYNPRVAFFKIDTVTGTANASFQYAISAPAKLTTALTAPSQSLASLDASSWTLGSARPHR